MVRWTTPGAASILRVVGLRLLAPLVRDASIRRCEDNVSLLLLLSGRPPNLRGANGVKLLMGKGEDFCDWVFGKKHRQEFLCHMESQSQEFLLNRMSDLRGFKRSKFGAGSQ